MAKGISTLSEKSLKQTALRALENDAVALNDLIYFMAAEEIYNDVIFDLWDIYDLNSDKNNRLPPNEYADLDLVSKYNRRGVWYWLWMRMAAISEESEFYFKDLPPRDTFPLYKFKRDRSGRGELVELGDEERRSLHHYMKLPDLINFFKKIEKYHGLYIPLPKLLFPDQIDTVIETEEPLNNRLDKEFPTPEIPGFKKDVIKLMQAMKPEIKQLYSYMIANIINEPEPEDFKDTMLSYYDENTCEQLNKKYLEEDSLYYYGKEGTGISDDSNRKRDFIGKLCQIVISDHFPKILTQINKPSKGYSAKRLYDNLYKKL